MGLYFLDSCCYSAISYPSVELKAVKEISMKEAKVEIETQLVKLELKVSDCLI